MRFACFNKFGRYVTYTGQFEEGVSLSYIDEVKKMKKFTYGACEMCFNPIKDWITKGVTSKIIVKFLKAEHIGWFQKVNVCIYLSTYFAMASVFYYVILEGVCSIVYPELYEKYMIRSFDVMLTCVVIFGASNLVGEVVFNWKLESLKGKSLFVIIWDEFKWIPLLSLYFNSILFHLTLSSLGGCGVTKTWGATNKDVKHQNCMKSFFKTLKTYKFEYLFMMIISIVYIFFMVRFKLNFYQAWSVMSFASSMMIGPIILNPDIMSLNY
jgi:hypothetical protein